MSMSENWFLRVTPMKLSLRQLVISLDKSLFYVNLRSLFGPVVEKLFNFFDKIEPETPRGGPRKI